MPLISRTFDQLIDFTRTSAATYVNSAGLVALTPPSVNLLTYTQEFDNAAWSKSNTTALPFNPATANYGPNVVVNGDFASATGWTVNTGWAIGSGVATATTTSSSLFGGFTSVSGQWYKVTFDCTITAGTLAVYIGVGTQASFTTGGAKTVFLQSGATTSRGIEFFGGAVSGTVDNVVVQAVTTNTGFITAPDGTMTGDILIPNTVSTTHVAQQSVTTTGLATFSVYAKAGGYNRIVLATNLNNYVYFNLSNGTVESSLGTGWTSATITDAGNGWYRCAAITPTSQSRFDIFPFNAAQANGNTAPTFAGDGTSGVFVWGAQVELVPDANLVLGSELSSTGVIGLVGSATAATYNTGTGAGSVTRVDASNQSYVEWTAAISSLFRMAITGNTGTTNVRNGTYTASFTAVTAGQTVVIPVSSSGAGQISATSGSGTSTFTITSLRQITSITGMPSAYAKNVGGLFPPRFDYDPVTLTPRGILIEEQRSNLVTYSEQFDNAAWAKGNTTVTANATVSPDGTTNADKLVEDTATSTHSTVSPTIALTTGTAYTTTVYVKAAERSWIALQYDSGAFGTAPTAYFNIGAGTVGSAFNGATHSIRNAGNGWYRCSITATTTSSANSNARIYLATADNVASYTGVAGNGAFVWGAQLEAGAFATSYIPTVASTVTRAADIAVVTAANFSSWYNQPSGTFVVEVGRFSSIPTTAIASFITITDNPITNDWIYIIGDNAGVSSNYTNAGVSQANLVIATPISSGGKAAFAYAANNFAAAVSGGAVATDTSGTLSTDLTILRIGGFASNPNFLNGYIRSIRYYPARLNNAQLQTLTA
jgi:hypothetical protein